MSSRTPIAHHHGGISVPSLAESVAWWSDVMGFTLAQDIDIPVIPAKIAMMKRGDLRIELFEVEDAHPLPPERSDMNGDLHVHGHKHIAFAVPDLDQIVTEMTARGADIVTHKRAPWGAFLFIRDNAGNLIEFCEQKDLFA
jgi:methylmalonyl-CoA/ethylmalonyl-CoA epimerase